PGIKPTGAGHEAEIERADPRRGSMQNAEPVPTILDRADLERRLGGKREHRLAIAACERALAGQDDRLRKSAEIDRREGVGSGAQIVVLVGEVCLLTNQADPEIAGPPALADTGVEDGRFPARIGTD